MFFAIKTTIKFMFSIAFYTSLLQQYLWSAIERVLINCSVCARRFILLQLTQIPSIRKKDIA